MPRFATAGATSPLLTLTPCPVAPGGATPTGAGAAGAPRAVTLTLGRLRPVGRLLAGRRVVVSITASRHLRLVLRLTRGRTVIRRLTATGGPGTIAFHFVAPAAGRYTLTVTGGRLARRLGLTIRPRRRR